MLRMHKISLIVLLATGALFQKALACMPPLPQFHYEYSEETHQTIATDGFRKQEVNLAKDYKEIVQTQDIYSVLRFGSDGNHAFFFERPIVGAEDYKTLEPIQNTTEDESARYGWRYYKDRHSIYVAKDDGKEVMLYTLSSYKPDQYRLAQGILVLNNKAYSEQLELPFKGSDFQTQHIARDFYLVSDGHSSYAPSYSYAPTYLTSQHIEGEEWSRDIGWSKIADLPKLKIIGHIVQIHNICGYEDYYYDVIHEIDGQVFINKTKTDIRADLSNQDELLNALEPYLLQLHLVTEELANKKGIIFKTDLQYPSGWVSYGLVLKNQWHGLKAY
ncbi:hypothetical protein [Aquirhabdus parva]|uniref:Lipoprotein n=1 Tax=Aquirhabdus parva TaxID=2283318 RepID=A0A345P9C8_9GAMM|nr:hypothetical protein [Aquirhabdus parva]AXI03887.1 hypothetical protein HYN46_14195 [Aquirhabdus parva]